MSLYLAAPSVEPLRIQTLHHRPRAIDRRVKSVGPPAVELTYAQFLLLAGVPEPTLLDSSPHRRLVSSAAR